MDDIRRAGRSGGTTTLPHHHCNDLEISDSSKSEGQKRPIQRLLNQDSCPTETAARSCLMTDRDRHGNVRRYYRRHGRKIRLRHQPGSSEFQTELDAAIALIGSSKGASRAKAYAGPFVYFAIYGSNARVKIGTAMDPRKRLKSIATGTPGKVRIYYVTPGGRDLERTLHAKFNEDRINGEWFIYSKAIRAWIDEDEARRFAERAAKVTPRLQGGRL